MKISIFDNTGKEKSKIEINPKDFGEKINESLVAQALRVYEFNGHQRTSKAKTRGEISGSTRKIYRQKGTGRARHGDRYAPIFVGGGVAHGPKGQRKKNLKLPKKMKRKALGSAILLKIKEKDIAGISDTKNIPTTTKKSASLMKKIANHPKNKVLIITKEKAENLYKSTKNLQGITLKQATIVNTHDIVSHDYILLTKNAIKTIIERVKGITKREENNKETNTQSKTTNKEQKK